MHRLKTTRMLYCISSVVLFPLISMNVVHAAQSAQHPVIIQMPVSSKIDGSAIGSLSSIKKNTALSKTQIAYPKIPRDLFNVRQYGAQGDDKTINTISFQWALDSCSKAGGGTVDVPIGRYVTGPLVLHSNTNLHIRNGATLCFINTINTYPMKGGSYQNCISADNAHDIAITGNGTIDGQGAPWWAKYRKPKGSDVSPDLPRRPNLIVFSNCQRVLVEKVSLINSPCFHLVPDRCTDVIIDGVTIKSPADSPNTDGIDPSGHNYLITNCSFDVGDDCIAIKPSGKGDSTDPSCSNFLISHCTFLHGHGMSIGGQTPGGLQNLMVEDCSFDGTEAGIRMKASQGEGGLVENLKYQNITMQNVNVPILITSYYPHVPQNPQSMPLVPATATTPEWQNITISNLKAVNCGLAILIVGLPQMKIKNINFDNVQISSSRGANITNAEDIIFTKSSIVPQSGPVLVTHNATVAGLK